MSIARSGFLAPSAARAAGRAPHAVGAWRWTCRGCRGCRGRHGICKCLGDEPFHALDEGVEGVEGQILLRLGACVPAWARGHAGTHAYTRARARTLITLFTLIKRINNKGKMPMRVRCGR